MLSRENPNGRGEIYHPCLPIWSDSFRPVSRRRNTIPLQSQRPLELKPQIITQLFYPTTFSDSAVMSILIILIGKFRKISGKDQFWIIVIFSESYIAPKIYCRLYFFEIFSNKSTHQPAVLRVIWAFLPSGSFF